MCEPVEDIQEFRPVILGMVHYLYKHKLEGLSANECGYDKQVIVTNVPGDFIRILINPQMLILDYDMELVEERCASYTHPIKRHRHAHVLVDALNLKGERVVMDTSAKTYGVTGPKIAARLQHEMEHMLGLDVTSDPDLSVEQTSLADLLAPFEYRDQPAALLDDYIVEKFL